MNCSVKFLEPTLSVCAEAQVQVMVPANRIAAVARVRNRIVAPLFGCRRRVAISRRDCQVELWARTDQWPRMASMLTIVARRGEVASPLRRRMLWCKYGGRKRPAGHEGSWNRVR